MKKTFKINQVKHLEGFEIKITKFENLRDEDQTTGKKTLTKGSG
jgi:hypothetical protein